MNVPPPARAPGGSSAYGPPPFGQSPVPLPPPIPASPRSRLVAGLLGVFLGAFGVHRFYLGCTSIGLAQIVVTVLTCGVGAVWGVVEGLMILTRSTITEDVHGRPLRD